LQNLYDNNGSPLLNYYEAVGKSDDELWNSAEAQINSNIRRAYYARVIHSLDSSIILDYGGRTGVNISHESLNGKARYVYDFGRKKDSYVEGIIPLETLDLENYFDIILCSHTLEHETDPVLTLRKLRKLINPRGHLYLEVPFEFPERMISRRPGGIWHVNYFSRKSLIEIADRSSWLCRSMDLFYLPYNTFYNNCLVAIFSPDTSRRGMNKPVSNIEILKDVKQSLSNTLIASCLTLLRTIRFGK